MTLFVIDAEHEQSLLSLKSFAENNKIEVDEMLDIYNRQVKPVGDRKEFVCSIPIGYKVVFCIEFQKKGYARHMSVSGMDELVHPVVVEELMKVLGFVGEIKSQDVMVYFENENTVVNVVEYIKEG